MQSFIESKQSLYHYDELCKTAFLSYYISSYITNIDTKDRNEDISVDEIYDFLCDLKNELHIKIPHIDKRDISLCFHILSKLGLCHCLK